MRFTGSLYLCCWEIEQVWGQEYVDFGAICLCHVKGRPHQPSHHHHSSAASYHGHANQQVAANFPGIPE